MISNINTTKLNPHPENPRRDLGDLTELAESIKRQGVLQNLTVIADGTDKYTVVIGHRRLAAARLAGIETVPCVVSDMDEAQQIRTMLSENMQRSDLTIYEQAQGFQMMLDLGDSLSKSHYALRREFLRNITNTACKKALSGITALFIDVASAENLCGFPFSDIAYLLGLDSETDGLEGTLISENSEFKAAVAKAPEKVLTCIIFCASDSARESYWSSCWNSQRQTYEYRLDNNEMLDRIYEVLALLGYEMSDEEKAVQNGTHTLYTKEESET